ncbi:MAG: hypothetical protein E7A88_09060, partial [Dermabacter sp.]|nr:hypothetical protein [Dermabacter sp.]
SGALSAAFSGGRFAVREDSSPPPSLAPPPFEPAASLLVEEADGVAASVGPPADSPPPQPTNPAATNATTLKTPQARARPLNMHSPDPVHYHPTPPSEAHVT